MVVVAGVGNVTGTCQEVGLTWKHVWLGKEPRAKEDHIEFLYHFCERTADRQQCSEGRIACTYQFKKGCRQA